jgi:hypothetical protein
MTQRNKERLMFKMESSAIKSFRIDKTIQKLLPGTEVARQSAIASARTYDAMVALKTELGLKYSWEEKTTTDG